MVDAPQVVADALPDMHWVYGPNLDMDASFRDERGRLVNRRRQFGTMILSRWPILSSRNFPLPKWGDVARHSIQQGMLEAVIAPEGQALRVYSVHLSHLCPETRLPQVEAIRDILRRAPEEGGAWCGGHPDPDSGWTEGEPPPMPEEAVLMGDLNCAPDSAEYARLVGPHAPKHGRLVERAGLCDAWTASGLDESEGSTHPDAGRRIDHILLSSRLAPQARRVWVDDAAQGSDHWPVWCDLDWPGVA
jgi:endonuclease/exonuclease/phosphatase family metal-dependent hydrolase